ncbi:MAG: single-stranded DNA-binding protein [Bacilli bacterium]|nr:single-stranded DNA-binding protein [Bacilli bacterium]
MVNQIVLVGRIAKAPETKTTETGRKYATMTLAVPRNYKNSNGEYDTDFLDCTLWSAVAESTSEYCKTGDMIGVKGRVQSRIIETPEGTKKRKTEIIAEKVTFLTSNPSRKKKEELRETDEASESDE